MADLIGSGKVDALIRLFNHRGISEGFGMLLSDRDREIVRE
jgi:hypothetical protein